MGYSQKRSNLKTGKKLNLYYKSNLRKRKEKRQVGKAKLDKKSIQGENEKKGQRISDQSLRLYKGARNLHNQGGRGVEEK